MTHHNCVCKDRVSKSRKDGNEGLIFIPLRTFEGFCVLCLSLIWLVSTFCLSLQCEVFICTHLYVVLLYCIILEPDITIIPALGRLKWRYHSLRHGQSELHGPIFFFFKHHLFVYLCECCYSSAHGKVREQLSGTISLLPLYSS